MCVNMFALRQSPRPEDIQRRPPVVQQAPQGDDKTIIDIKGRSMSPIKIEQDSVTIEAVSLVGNVIAYHNGSVITRDSAGRDSNRRIECFGNVSINNWRLYTTPSPRDGLRARMPPSA